MEADVVVNLSTAIATIGVMVALFVRIDKRIDGVEMRIDRLDSKFETKFDKMDGKFEARFHRTDAKIDAMARDIVDVKVSVARIEGFLEAREGFIPVGTNRPGSEPTAEQPATGYRQTG